MDFVDISLKFGELVISGCGQSVVLTFDGARAGAKTWCVTNLKDFVVLVHSLDVIPGDKGNLFVRGNEASVVVAQDLLDHGWPPVGEGTGLADEGEVGGVGNAVCVDSTVHLATVEVSESFDLGYAGQDY